MCEEAVLRVIELHILLELLYGHHSHIASLYFAKRLLAVIEMERSLRVAKRGAKVNVYIFRSVTVGDIPGVNDPRLVEMGVPADMDRFSLPVISCRVKIHVHALFVVPVDKKAKPLHFIRDPDRHPAWQISAFLGLPAPFEPAVGEVILLRLHKDLFSRKFCVYLLHMSAQHCFQDCPDSFRIRCCPGVEIAECFISSVQLRDFFLAAADNTLRFFNYFILRLERNDFSQKEPGILRNLCIALQQVLLPFPQRAINALLRRVLVLAVQRVEDIYDRMRADRPGFFRQFVPDLIIRIAQPQKPADHAQQHARPLRNKIQCTLV